MRLNVEKVLERDQKLSELSEHAGINIIEIKVDFVSLEIKKKYIHTDVRIILPEPNYFIYRTAFITYEIISLIKSILSCCYRWWGL